MTTQASQIKVRLSGADMRAHLLKRSEWHRKEAVLSAAGSSSFTEVFAESHVRRADYFELLAINLVERRSFTLTLDDMQRLEFT